MDQDLCLATLPAVTNRNRPQGRSMAAAPVRRAYWAPENWRAVGSCRDSDPNLFFPIGRGRHAYEQTEEAKTVCRGCPSREPCLAFALGTRQQLGIWGGTSAEDRRQLTRGRLRTVAS